MTLETSGLRPFNILSRLQQQSRIWSILISLTASSVCASHNIVVFVGEIESHRHIYICQSEMGHEWELSGVGGKPSSPRPSDASGFVEIVANQQAHHQPLTALQLIEEAQRLERPR
jgi:hypothetical protein